MRGREQERDREREREREIERERERERESRSVSPLNLHVHATPVKPALPLMQRRSESERPVVREGAAVRVAESRVCGSFPSPTPSCSGSRERDPV